MIPPSSSPQLVGRDREQATLREALDAAVGGRGSLVLIGGEAGIGKTALAEWLCADASENDALVLVGRCYDLAETPPYGPWGEALGRVSRDGDLPALPAAVLGSGVEGDHLAGQAAIFARVCDFCASLAARRPVVLLLEDLHWADPASLDLLRALSRRLGAIRLLAIATYRADELTRRHPLYRILPALVREAPASRADLRRLAPGDNPSLLRHYGLAPDDESRLAEYLAARAEGNPFYIGELLRTLEGDSRLRREGGRWVLDGLDGLGLPPLLRQIIDVRAGRLGEPARASLAQAAVIGQEVPLALWADVAEATEESLLDTVERAVEARLVFESPDGSTIRFAHALVREALYEGLLAARRRRLHRRVGEALAALAGPDPDAVAYHFQRAGDDRAGAWLVAAGERAQRAYAVLTAAARYEAALALLADEKSTAGERGWLQFRLGRMRRNTDHSLARDSFEEARRLGEIAQDRALAATARGHLGLLLVQEGQGGRGLAEMGAATDALEALSPQERARINIQDALSSAADVSELRGTLALWLANLGQYSEAATMAERFLARIAAPS